MTNKTGINFQAIPNESMVHLVNYEPPFSTVCSIGKAPFCGTIEIKFKPGDLLLEFESFEIWLFTLSNQSMTIEDLCRLVFDQLTGALGNIPMSVTVHAKTTVHAPVSAQIKRGDT